MTEEKIARGHFMYWRVYPTYVDVNIHQVTLMLFVYTFKLNLVERPSTTKTQKYLEEIKRSII